MGGPRRRRDAAGRVGRGGTDGPPRTRPIRRSEASIDAKRRPARSASGSAGEDAGTCPRRRRRRERRRRRAQGRRLRRERPRRRSRPGRGTDRPRTTDDRARPIYRRRPPRGSCEAGRVGGITPRTAGREAQNCAVPEDARRAPQGTDRAPLPPAPISSRIAERSEMGGWGERAHARVRGEGGRARRPRRLGGGPTTAYGGPSPLPRRFRSASRVCILHLTR